MGRPKGSKNKKTLEKERLLKETNAVNTLNASVSGNLVGVTSMSPSSGTNATTVEADSRHNGKPTLTSHSEVK